jgi:hypothetical protein
MSVLWQTLNTHAKENGLSGLVELEPKLNAGEVELPDVPKLTEQLLTLVLKGSKVTHQPGDHDDYAAATAVAVWAASSAAIHRLIRFGPIVEKLKSGFVPSRDHRPGVADSRLAQGRDVYASMQRGGGRL